MASVSTKDDADTMYPSQACHLLELNHPIHLFEYKRMKKAYWKAIYNISKTELMNALRTIFYVEK